MPPTKRGHLAPRNRIETLDFALLPKFHHQNKIALHEKVGSKLPGVMRRQVNAPLPHQLESHGIGGMTS